MKLLVISLAGIGDTLFATPLIHELRANFPCAQIDALVLWRGSKDVLENNPHLNAIHQHNFISEGKITSLKFLWRLRREKYDASFNTHPQSRIQYRVIARIIGARTRISHHYHNPRWLDRLLANKLLQQDYNKHAIENNLALLQFAGAKTVLPTHDYQIFLSDEEKKWADEFVFRTEIAGKKIFGVHIGSGGTKNLALRRWPVANYLELIRRLLKTRQDLVVLLFGGPEEQKDNAFLLAQTDSKKVFQPQTKNLRHAAALAGRCDLFLSVDTALMHLAAAMKARNQIVIETPTWNKPIEPSGNPFLLVPNPSVAGRNLEYYRYDGRGIRGTASEVEKCMASVSVDSVFRAVNEALLKS